MDENDEFTFSIEGKNYTISEKDKSPKKNQNQPLHIPSLTIGGVIAGICIVGIFFVMGDFSESSEPLIERQISEEKIEPTQISIDTFIQNGSPILGNTDATITLVEFGDYQCHFCNVYYQNTEHKIFQNYVSTGKVNVIFKDYTIMGQDSVTAAHAAHCAGEQGKFWEYHNTLYDNYGGENNGWVNQESILNFAKQAGLDTNEFFKCTENKKFERKISASNADAQILGITGTPAFYVISADSNQVQAISGAQPYEVFERIFNTMLEN